MAKKLHTEDDESARKIGDRRPMLNWADDLGKSIRRDLDAAVETFLESGSHKLKPPMPVLNDTIKPVRAEQPETDLKSAGAVMGVDYATTADRSVSQVGMGVHGWVSELLSGESAQSKIEAVEDRPAGKLQNGEMKTVYGNRGRNLTRLEQLIASGILNIS